MNPQDSWASLSFPIWEVPLTKPPDSVSLLRSATLELLPLPASVSLLGSPLGLCPSCSQGDRGKLRAHLGRRDSQTWAGEAGQVGLAQVGEGTKPLPVSPHSGKPQAFLISGSTSLPAAPRPGSLTTSPFHTHFPSLPPRYPGQWLHSCPPLPSPSFPLLSSLFSHGPLFSPSLALITPLPWCRSEDGGKSFRAWPGRTAILCPLTSLSFFPSPPLSLSPSQAVCSNLDLCLWLATLPSPNQGCPTCFSHHTVPVPWPATCPEVSSGGSGWQVAAPSTPFWPSLSP